MPEPFAKESQRKNLKPVRVKVLVLSEKFPIEEMACEAVVPLPSFAEYVMVELPKANDC